MVKATGDGDRQPRDQLLQPRLGSRMSQESNFLRGLEDDGLYTPMIKAHSLEKIRRHNLYAHMFSTSMKNRWPQRAYLGLYSGAGRAKVEETGEIAETTAMSVFRLRNPFTKYIFVDNDPRCIEALTLRVEALGGEHEVSFFVGDVNSLLGSIQAALPKFEKDRGLLSFCFVDPFAANLKFQTIRALGRYRMDFLILLALGVDVRRNFKRYYVDLSDHRIADLIDSPGWRAEYASVRGESVVRFVLRKFDEAMIGLGYQPARPSHLHPVKVRGTGVISTSWSSTASIRWPRNSGRQLLRAQIRKWDSTSGTRHERPFQDRMD